MFKFKANAKDVRIIWLESLATFKTSFPEWREEKREDKEGREGKVPPWLEIVKAENPVH